MDKLLPVDWFRDHDISAGPPGTRRLCTVHDSSLDWIVDCLFPVPNSSPLPATHRVIFCGPYDSPDFNFRSRRLR